MDNLAETTIKEVKPDFFLLGDFDKQPFLWAVFGKYVLSASWAVVLYILRKKLELKSFWPTKNL